MLILQNIRCDLLNQGIIQRLLIRIHTKYIIICNVLQLFWKDFIHSLYIFSQARLKNLVFETKRYVTDGVERSCDMMKKGANASEKRRYTALGRPFVAMCKKTQDIPCLKLYSTTETGSKKMHKKHRNFPYDRDIKFKYVCETRTALCNPDIFAHLG